MFGNKSIFVCIKSWHAEYIGRCKIGDRILVPVGFCGMSERYSGKIVAIVEEAHGKIVYMRADQDSSMGKAWKIIPFWIGCGQQGVLCPWKYPEVEAFMKAWEKQEECLADNCWAC